MVLMLAYIFLVVMTLFYAGITFGVLTTFWGGKNKLDFIMFVLVSGLSVHFGIEVWGNIL